MGPFYCTASLLIKQPKALKYTIWILLDLALLTDINIYPTHTQMHDHNHYNICWKKVYVIKLQFSSLRYCSWFQQCRKDNIIQQTSLRTPDHYPNAHWRHCNTSSCAFRWMLKCKVTYSYMRLCSTYFWNKWHELSLFPDMINLLGKCYPWLAFYKSASPRRFSQGR